MPEAAWQTQLPAGAGSLSGALGAAGRAGPSRRPPCALPWGPSSCSGFRGLRLETDFIV